MDVIREPGDRDKCPRDEYVQPGDKDIQVQLVISLGLGISAFLAFCILRPRWKSLYAARKRHSDPNVASPNLPNSFLGWIPALYKITEEEVLASAGLDAFVFLAFFKMAIRLFLCMFFFAAVVLEPINRHFDARDSKSGKLGLFSSIFRPPNHRPYYSIGPQFGTQADDDPEKPGEPYFWAYLVFVYVFTFLTLWFMNSETFRVIKVRQDYLGTQSTITDRTFRLSGIPPQIKSEERIKQLVEKLEIGLVENVTLCRKWKELDDLVAQRASILQKLEETWTVYHAQKVVGDALQQDPRTQDLNEEGEGDGDEEAGESGRLLPGEVGAHQYIDRPRPQARIWYGFLRLQSRRTDALNYYEEKLRQLDEKIRVARKKEYEASDIAFVTMDSIAACQMAIQALLDPRPGQLLTKLAPAPSDVVWHNTYAPRTNRRLRSWLITLFVAFLSIVWLIPVASIASLFSLCTIKQWSPSLAESLSRHAIIQALFQTGVPTAFASLLTVAVPYLYDFLSNYQGMISQGDVELSIISKNFFFTFFNIFLVVTIFGTATKIWDVFRDSLKDTTLIARTLANELQRLNNFYLNFIMLQGIGLFPFRLLEFGSVTLYPVYRMGAKTPRDFAQIMEPPIFSYGFYLPTALLVFILCLVYSVLPSGYLVLFFGIIYFTLGYFTYKYQLLYAMDQPQHATGGAWRIICYRIVLGLIVFHVNMAGYLALKKSFVQAVLVGPLLVFVVWYSFYFKRRFEPLTRFISLRSIKRDVDDEGLFPSTRQAPGLRRRASTVDEDKEKGLRFVNPSMIIPLEQPWIYQEPPPLVPETESEAGDYDSGESVSGEARRQEHRSDQGNAVSSGSNSSSFSLGDTHVWRDAGNDDSNV